MNVTGGFSRGELKSQHPPLNIEMVLRQISRRLSSSINWLQWKFPLTSVYFGSSPKLVSASSNHSCSVSACSFAGVYGKHILKLKWGQRLKVVRGTKEVQTSSQISRPIWDQGKNSPVHSLQLAGKAATLSHRKPVGLSANDCKSIILCVLSIY